jgi:hypothetical protein
MIAFRKVVLPSGVDREVQNFAGSMAQKVLHNKLVDGLNSAREKLEKASALDDFLRHQGEIRAYLHALSILHETTTSALKEQFYV